MYTQFITTVCCLKTKSIYADIKSGFQIVEFSVIKLKCPFDCQMTDGWPAAVGEYVHTWLEGTFVNTWIVLYFNKLRNYRSAKHFRHVRSVMIGYSLQSNKTQTLYISPKTLYVHYTFRSKTLFRYTKNKDTHMRKVSSKCAANKGLPPFY